MQWKALDSDGWLDLNQAKAWGARAVGLYPQSNLNAANMKLAADLDMGLWGFVENSASDPNGGALQAISDLAGWCNLFDSLNIVDSAGVFVPCDQEITDWVATMEYFHAGAETARQRGRVPAMYGQEVLWQKCEAAGYGYKYFVHAPDGNNPPYSGANIAQSRNAGSLTVATQITLGGVSADVDVIFTPDFGGFNADGAWTLGSAPTPPQPDTEDDMKLAVDKTTPAGPVFLVVGLTKHALSNDQVAAYEQLGLKRNLLNAAELASIPTV